MIGSWIALAACVRGGVPAEPLSSDVWLEVEPGKEVCAPAFPDVPWRREAHAAGTAAALRALSAGDLRAADGHLAALPLEHPATRAARALLELMGADAESPARELVTLVEQHPRNPCLASSAALALWANGNLGDAARLVTHARALAPTDPRIAFLSWYLELESAADLEPVVVRGLADEPGHPGMRLVQGVAAFERGDVGAAAAPLRDASVRGLTEADPVLLQVAFQTGQWPDYLRAASRLGLPLGDEGALATAEDPVAALRDLLGIKPGTALVAHFETSLGALTCTLRPDLAPVTVANFVGLARGTQPWTDPRTGEARRAPLYDATLFHRVIPGFMVQGGDPMGSGSGGPGYTFVDEVSDAVRFDRAGVLAMANRGPHTNGSQFFVTEAPAPHLDGSYTIFGFCDEASVDVVRQIAAMETVDARPVEPVTLHSVRIGD